MAGSAKYTTNITISGLGDEDQMTNTVTSVVTPAEVSSGKMVCTTVPLILPVGGIATGSVHLVYAESISGTIYIDSISTTTAISNCLIKMPVGESMLVPLNTGLSTTSWTVMTSTGSGTVEYLLFGS